MSNPTNNNNNNSNPPRFGAPANPPGTPPPATGNRFGSGAPSRFGTAPTPPPAPAPAPASRFGSGTSSAPRFGSRFGGREEALWTVAPLRLDAVRISLEGLGDPFHRLLGTPINAVFSKAGKVIEALGKDEDLLKRLADVLNDSWAKYEFRGAALLYPWDENIRKAYNQPLQPTPPPVEKKEAESDDDDFADEQLPDWLAAPSQKSSVCLRAVDTAFVLNILARSRANVVVANTPLALEPGFLDQSLLCDDPRIVALARATGCIEENW